ncbi:NUDIX hydrolase [Leucobacter allii]|uniref:NUDIX hydrolase n=1 Tax=Leucobacter allii TaxID=2932247 RepID=A0ABY4FI42_9MICO|nr:NUDIX domain-containing protein [Leucobacter allii]UOQ56346.1 NUDIX hydrolase [Leucobacter allii]UOR00813.1 NUDIX hydrolase [Leucobacter allii]
MSGRSATAEPAPGAEILAAGTVCWRRVRASDGGERVMVLLIHRTKQRDVSFPKGKLDPGESMPQAAVRETREETGLSVSLGVNLGTIQYALSGGRSKTVQYWAAEVTAATALASTFTPNGEVQALEWVPVEEARRRLSYRADRELYDVFLGLAEHGLLETFSVTLLRHAKAEPRSAAFPEDRARPLRPSGEEQAETLVPILEAFGPRRILSSTATRCLATVAPLAEHLGKRVREKEELSQDFWDAGDLDPLRRTVGKLVAKARSAIVCSHRPVLPDLARELTLATGSVPGRYIEEAAALPPAGFSVFHFSRLRPGAGILGVETYPLQH